MKGSLTENNNVISKNESKTIKSKTNTIKHKAKKKHRKKKASIKIKETSTKGQQITSDDHSTNQTKRSRPQQFLKPLNGLTIAISSLDTGKQHETKENSYKSIVEECKVAGASISGQVGKKVFAVVCNRSAVLQCTQRVRKALKKNVMILDIEWVRQSISQGERLDCQQFSLEDLAKEVLEQRETKKHNHEMIEEDVEFLSMQDIGSIPSLGWSVPVSYGCSCVCHENGDENCKWCTNPMCDINAAKFAKCSVAS